MKALLIIYMMLTVCCANAQQPVIYNRQEQALEELAAKEETEMEDDEFLQQAEVLKRNPVNLNTASREELQLLQMLSALQLKALIQYRELLGKLVNLYELQAIPYWDVETIRKALPYVTVEERALPGSQLKGLRKGSHVVMVRAAQAFNSEAPEQYPGSPQKLLVRYRFNYKDRLQLGLLAEKDAGERLAKGFDFYSFHLFLRKAGIVQSLALGDFAVNMGQGLIHWQSLSLGKSGELTTAKRQSPVLRPYTSSGEYNFHRGAGITLQRKKLSLTAFASFRKLDANLSPGSLDSAEVITSFLTSGLHRTVAELAERNNITQQSLGAALAYDQPSRHLGLNAISYQFSNPVHKRDEPYNLFSFRGRQLANYSIDYDRTWRNVHLFGELAASLHGGRALVQGMLVSLDRKLDASMLFRHISPEFQSLYAGAFTENSVPANESGLLLGLTLKPGRGYTINIYADVFCFPWLKFRTDGPSAGREYLVQLICQPHKKLEISTRLRLQSKQANPNNGGETLNHLAATPRANWRAHITWQVNPALRLRQRVELLWINKTIQGEREVNPGEQGFLVYTDIQFNPPLKAFDVGGRLQLFETDGFNSRIYAFENDVSSYAVHAVYHKGLRYYLNAGMDLQSFRKRAQVRYSLHTKMYFRWAQTITEMKDGTGFQPIKTLKSGEFKMGMIFSKN